MLDLILGPLIPPTLGDFLVILYIVSETVSYYDYKFIVTDKKKGSGKEITLKIWEMRPFKN